MSDKTIDTIIESGIIPIVGCWLPYQSPRRMVMEKIKWLYNEEKECYYHETSFKIGPNRYITTTHEMWQMGINCWVIADSKLDNHDFQNLRGFLPRSIDCVRYEDEMNALVDELIAEMKINGEW